MPGLDVGVLVGRVLSEVKPVGKHLLMQFDDRAANQHDDALGVGDAFHGAVDGAVDGADGDVASGGPLLLRTHMRMSGSWHVYSLGDRWQRPQRQARVVIEAGDRLAVCFNAPVVELTRESVDAALGVSHLGPDILGDGFDPSGVARRAALDERAIGEVLLDQRVVAGIGNIYRCESLHLERIHPWTAASVLDLGTLTTLVERARKLMLQNLSPSVTSRDLDMGGDGTWVYRRSGLPCRTCSSLIRSRPQGDQARMAYWCPNCQPPHPPPQ